MHFLDRQKINRADQQVVRLHDIFIQAYDEEYDALALAGQVGILKADIERFPKLRSTWWSILEEFAREKQLRRLVDIALRDPTSANWHGQLREVIDIPFGQITTQSVEFEQAEVETAEHRRSAGRRPKVGMRANLWDVGSTLKVTFINGPSGLQSKVINAATQWLEYANLKFDFGDHKKAEIRISFDKPGSWAYQGTTALAVSDTEPTVNFGWLNEASPLEEVERVVLHEFGHVLGLQHEHGNPASALKWNRPKVYDLLSGPPNFWSRNQIDNYVFSVWPPSYFPVYKVFDPESIMIFAMPEEYFIEGDGIKNNNRLSSLDKQFAAALYPLRAKER